MVVHQANTLVCAVCPCMEQVITYLAVLRHLLWHGDTFFNAVCSPQVWPTIDEDYITAAHTVKRIYFNW